MIEQTVMIKSGKWKKLNAQIFYINDADIENTRNYIVIEDGQSVIVPLANFISTKIFNLATNTNKIRFNAMVLAVKFADTSKLWMIEKEDLAIATKEDDILLSSQSYTGQRTQMIKKPITVMSLDIDDQTRKNDGALTKLTQDLTQQFWETTNINDYLDVYFEKYDDKTLDTSNTWAFSADNTKIKEGNIVANDQNIEKSIEWVDYRIQMLLPKVDSGQVRQNDVKMMKFELPMDQFVMKSELDNPIQAIKKFSLPIRTSLQDITNLGMQKQTSTLIEGLDFFGDDHLIQTIIERDNKSLLEASGLAPLRLVDRLEVDHGSRAAFDDNMFVTSNFIFLGSQTTITDSTYIQAIYVPADDLTDYTPSSNGSTFDNVIQIWGVDAETGAGFVADELRDYDDIVLKFIQQTVKGVQPDQAKILTFNSSYMDYTQDDQKKLFSGIAGDNDSKPIRFGLAQFGGLDSMAFRAPN